EELWRELETLGDEQSHFLLERFVAGDVFHVDSIVVDGECVLEEAHRYETPPFDVMHGGGIFCTRTVRRGSELEAELRAINREIVAAVGLTRGVLHTEFIRGREDGRFRFLETAARVGGANIVEMVEASTGVNLWREWAKLEVSDVERRPYSAPERRSDYGGVVISLARQERPDTSAYNDPEIVWRLDKKHHVGLIVASPDPERVERLLHEYMNRILADFHASLPAPDKPTA
ncbi:MAG: ATP-grasp domain-containing protein, partial [Longimicrobiales bacterium]